MTASQDNLLDSGENEAQGEDLLDQSVDSGRDSSEDVVEEYDRVLGLLVPSLVVKRLIFLKMTASQTLSCSAMLNLQPGKRTLKARTNPQWWRKFPSLSPWMG